MRRVSILVLAALFGASIISAGPVRAEGGASRYIVVLEPGAGDPGSVAADHANDHSAVVSHIYRYALRGYAAVIPDSRVDDVASDPRVAYVSEDRVVEASPHKPNHNPGGGGGTPAPPPAQTLPTGVNRIDADASVSAAIDGVDTRVNVDVAVIDTGVDLDHPDLNVNVAGGENCTTGSTFDDGNGHGTHVAGTIGALDNSIGVVGVAPGARIWPVRVLDNRGSGYWSWIICGIDYVTQHENEIEVANMSLGGSGSDTGGCSGSALHDAICDSVAAGVTYAVAAGNESTNASTRVPASYDEVITVSALADFNGLAGGGAPSTCRSDVDDTFADFSNYGSDVDLIAPGVCINSTWKGGGYSTISGTSMAAPHVAGAAALYKAANPSASPAAVKSALQGAGNTNWNVATDPDTTDDVLLNVAAI